MNAIKIFNEKEVEELMILDIGTGEGPDFDYLAELAGECFMPICYGGRICSLEDIERLFYIGFEKVSLHNVLKNKREIITEASRHFGSQSIVACIEVKKSFFGKIQLVDQKDEVLDYVQQLQDLGAGELLVSFVQRDGMMKGYDIASLKQISSALTIPVIAFGGAGSLDHIKDVFENTQVQAVAAGSLFVYYGKHKAVLINYPERKAYDAFI